MGELFLLKLNESARLVMQVIDTGTELTATAYSGDVTNSSEA